MYRTLRQLVLACEATSTLSGLSESRLDTVPALGAHVSPQDLLSKAEFFRKTVMLLKQHRDASIVEQLQVLTMAVEGLAKGQLDTNWLVCLASGGLLPQSLLVAQTTLSPLVLGSRQRSGVALIWL